MKRDQVSGVRSKVEGSRLEGWKVEKLGDVLQKTETVNPTQKPNEEFLYVDVSSVNNQNYSIENTTLLKGKDAPSRARKLIKAGDVIFATVRPTLKRIAIIPEEYDGQVCSTGYFVLRAKEFISNKYIFYFLQSGDFMGKMEKLQKGASYPAVTDNEVRAQEIPLPPLPEQKRIVSLLDETFAALAQVGANAARNLVNAREVFEAELNVIFGNGKDWETRELGDIGKVSMCKRIFKEQTATVGDIPFYKIGTFGKEPDAYISKEIYDEFRKNYSFPKKGDILISASGTIGRRVKYDGEPAYFQDSNIVWIDNDEKQVLNDYLYHFYGACNWNSTKGATIARLYTTNLKQLEIVFPKSLGEQRAIVQRLEGLSKETRRLEEVYRQKIE
ncbi:MAG TPA: restriction endonuclease subunit S, partial [Anaerolineales bacterium]|nr:restriction endonuclease subunit S [Anaerolineales bacterium]